MFRVGRIIIISIVNLINKDIRLNIFGIKYRIIKINGYALKLTF